jgi:hypothetical protein
MSAQEIIRELAKLNRDELTQVDLRLHELLQEKIRPGGKSWGEALLEVAGTVEGLPPDYAENHDHYLHNTCQHLQKRQEQPIWQLLR